MKEKIYLKLKQEFSALGLGNDVLQAHAEMLAGLGFVNDENIDAVVSGQKGFLEGLQKENDRRATDARKAGEESARKKFDEETKKAEEERKKAEEEAKKKAEKEAEEAKKKAEEEAKRKAEEEAEAKRLEELRKQKEIPEWFVKAQEEAAAKAKEEREAYEQRIASLMETNKNNSTQFQTLISDLQKRNEEILAGYNQMKEESEKQKAQAKIDAHRQFVLNKAKELGIPQYRIDEGFTIADDAEESVVIDTLSKISANIKANALPVDKNTQLGEGKATKEDMQEIAKLMIH